MQQALKIPAEVTFTGSADDICVEMKPLVAFTPDGPARCSMKLSEMPKPGDTIVTDVVINPANSR